MTAYITFVLDETGSMQELQGEAISGFNAYVAELRKSLKGRANFSLLKFNSRAMDWFVKGKALADVEELSPRTYTPAYTTPLWDAVAESIIEMDKRIKGKKNPKIIVTVLTDGFENASRQYTAEQVKQMMAKRKKWGFNFVGAGIDVWHATEALGVSPTSAIITPSTPDGMAVGMAAAALSATRFAGGMSASTSMYSGSRTADQYVQEQGKKK